MELPEPVANRIFVGTIAANANHMSAGAALPTFYVGGIINKSYYYREYYKIRQLSFLRSTTTGRILGRVKVLRDHTTACPKLTSLVN